MKKTGEPFDEHFRGTKLHFDKKGRIWWSAPLKTLRLDCVTEHPGLIQALMKVKEGGSFRITESRDVITRKVEEDDEEVAPPEGTPTYYVCAFDGKMSFQDGVTPDPDGVKPLHIWPSFYEGATYSFSPSGEIWWQSPQGPRWPVREPPKDLVEMLALARPDGGRFKINEYRRVLTLVRRIPIREDLEAEVRALPAAIRDVIEQRVESVEMVPIYVGEWKGKLRAEKPLDIRAKWTEERTEALLSRLKGLGEAER